MAGGVVFTEFGGRRPVPEIAADDIEPAVKTDGGGVVERMRKCSASAPPVGRRVVDLEVRLAEIAADHIDLAADLRRRQLRARRRQRRGGRALGAIIRPYL